MRHVCSSSALIALLMLTACAPQVIYGSDPNTDALGRLVLGESTETDIRRIIGTPRGRGEALWSMDMTKRDLLFYEKVRSKGRAVNLKMGARARRTRALPRRHAAFLVGGRDRRHGRGVGALAQRGPSGAQGRRANDDTRGRRGNPGYDLPRCPEF